MNDYHMMKIVRRISTGKRKTHWLQATLAMQISIGMAMLAVCLSSLLLTGCESGGSGGKTINKITCLINGEPVNLSGVSYFKSGDGRIAISGSAESANLGNIGIWLDSGIAVGTYDNRQVSAIIRYDNVTYAAGQRWAGMSPGNQMTVTITKNDNGLLSGTFEISAVEQRYNAPRRTVRFSQGVFTNVKEF